MITYSEWYLPETHPVANDTHVQFEFRNGAVVNGADGKGVRAGSVDWSQYGGPADIVRYRIVSEVAEGAPEYTGGETNYYKVRIDKPTSDSLAPYTAECNDIIEALDMNFAEGEAFKAIWRRSAARTLGKTKGNYTDGKYDAEKVHFFGGRLVAQSK